MKKQIGLICLSSLLILGCKSIEKERVKSGEAETSLEDNVNKIPKYLEPYKELYKKDPRTASLNWFSEAKYGLFLHYGVYSQLGKDAWAIQA